jgi:hypothetical protein
MNEIFNHINENFITQIFAHPMYLIVGAVFILLVFIILFDYD